jgi:membrane protein
LIKLKRILVTATPIAFIIRKSKSISVPGFKGLPIYDVVKFFFQQINKVGLNERAAAISFNLIMALPAALLFMFSIIPYLPDSESFQGQIMALFKDLSPNSSTYKFIQNTIEGLLTKQVGIFSFGFILLMFYASNATMGIIRTFDKSIFETKSYLFHQRLRSLRLTLVLFILILGAALVLIGQEQLAVLLKSIFHMKRKARIPWWNATRWFIIIGIVFFSISFIYKFAPSLKKRWPLISPGSFLATTLTILTTLLFSFWVRNFANYNKVYGSIGTVLILMFLIYINALILLIGFELNVSLTYLQAEAEKRKQHDLAALSI